MLYVEPWVKLLLCYYSGSIGLVIVIFSCLENKISTCHHLLVLEGWDLGHRLVAISIMLEEHINL